MAWLMALTPTAYMNSSALIRFHVRPYKATAIATLTAVLAGEPLTFCVIRTPNGNGYGSLATIKRAETYLVVDPFVASCWCKRPGKA